MSGVSPAWSSILDRCAAGDISPQIALSQLLLSGETPDPERLALAARDRRELAPLAALAERHRDRLAPLARLAGEVEPHGEDLVAATAATFDRLAAVAPEAAVAFYSLGDPALLDEATAELFAVVQAWAPADDREVLDFGCGFGRLSAVLAARASRVTGVDVSAGMLAEARRRHGSVPNLRFEHGGGRDLAPAADRSLDLFIAADSFPFLVRAGEEALRRHVAEVARVLRPGGDMLVFNWSYRGDMMLDVSEAHALADAHGFAVLRAGERPFAIWDAVGFHLRRTA